MKKKKYFSLFVFILGIFTGYYITKNNFFINTFSENYKAFQIGVYTDYNTAFTYSNKYNNSIIINDNELYRVYYSILKSKNNINKMSEYLNNNNISFYLKDISITDKQLKKSIKEYEDLMQSNDLVFLSINELILEKYKESI